MATSPLPCGGSPTLYSEGQGWKWLTSGQIGYITPAVCGIPNAWERETNSEVAHKWAHWLHHACCLGFPNASKQWTKSEVGRKWARWLYHACRLG